MLACAGNPRQAISLYRHSGTYFLYTTPTFALPEYTYAYAVGPAALGLMQAKHSYYIFIYLYNSFIYVVMYYIGRNQTCLHHHMHTDMKQLQLYKNTGRDLKAF